MDRKIRVVQFGTGKMSIYTMLVMESDTDPFLLWPHRVA